MAKIFSVLIFLGISSASLWAVAENYPSPKLEFGGYQASALNYGLVIANPHRPGTFFSILGYDEIALTEDGDEIRLGGFETQSIEEKPLEKIKSLFFPQPIKVVLRSSKGEVETEYRINQIGPQSIEVVRTLNSKKEIIGLQKGIIFNPEDEILLDGREVKKPEDSDLLEATGLTKVTIRSPGLPKTLSIQTEPSSTITIDFAFHIIKETILFSSPTKFFENFQLIKAEEL